MIRQIKIKRQGLNLLPSIFIQNSVVFGLMLSLGLGLGWLQNASTTLYKFIFEISIFAVKINLFCSQLISWRVQYRFSCPENYAEKFRYRVIFEVILKISAQFNMKLHLIRNSVLNLNGKTNRFQFTSCFFEAIQQQLFRNKIATLSRF